MDNQNEDEDRTLRQFYRLMRASSRAYQQGDEKEGRWYAANAVEEWLRAQHLAARERQEAIEGQEGRP